MPSWEWESFEIFLNSNLWRIIDVGPLHSPIRTFSISRNDKLKLIIETLAEQDAKSSSVIPPPGTVRENSDKIVFSSLSGATAIANGVQPLGYVQSFNRNPTLGSLKEEASTSSIEVIVQKNKDIKYTIDWLANVPDAYHWPEANIYTVETIKTRNFGKEEEGGLILRSSEKRSNRGRNCANITVDGYDIYLCSSKIPEAGKINMPGFIIYRGDPSEDFRRKIRNCLSYSLGTYLVHLGHSSFCENWELISFKAISAYSLDGKAFDVPLMPPAPLSAKYQLEIDNQYLSRMVNSIYLHYDELEFDFLSWAYWHAVCASYHIAPIHYGAMIKSLQRCYLKTRRDMIKTTLLGQNDWNDLKSLLEIEISKLPTNSKTRDILINKIKELNNCPRGELVERLLNTLNIKLGKVEKDAWKRRDDAAHGNRINQDYHVHLIKDAKLLRIRFNRMLLSMTGANDLYHDYYSLNQPIRNLHDPV